MRLSAFALFLISLPLSGLSSVEVPGSAAGNCTDGFINPITDVSWECIFPIRVGGVQMGPTHLTDPTGSTSNPICTCEAGAIPRVGIKVEFWEPARIIDTVSTPYCLMALGTKIASPSPGTRRGGLVNSPDGTGKAFAQMHYYIFPGWQMLDMFWDLPCMEGQGFDVAMLSELDPTWNNEILSLLLNPEAVLFANPVAALACAGDSAAANLGYPRNELFWCMGSWGNAYPVAGSITSTDFVEANAGLAARGIMAMARLGLVHDTSHDGCSISVSRIWKKNRYRLQMAKPVRQSGCMPIGQDALVWTAGHSPTVSDNFMWIQFRKVDCCVSY